MHLIEHAGYVCTLVIAVQVIVCGYVIAIEKHL